MKSLTTFVILFFSFFSYSQNMIYFERQSPYADFSSGNGQVALQELGVSSTIDVFVKYKQLVGGNPISTGWISHSGAVYSDVYDDTIRVVGVYNGDTLIRSKHLFDPNNYEVINATASGFGPHGMYDLNTGNPWEIVITFDGPTSNGDAEIQLSLFGGSATSVNNVLTIDSGISPIPPFNEFVFFNNGKSRMSIRSLEVNYTPNNPTNNTLLNAYIPRVTTRPATINDCGGEINFERMQLVNDVSLEYSINGAPYSALTNDNLSGLCAYDSISVLGYSPTIMPGDTLVRTKYVLRSADSLGQNDFDLAEVNISLNQNATNPTGCDNTLTFTHFQGTSTQGYGLLMNEFGEVVIIEIDPNFNEFGSICQAQYYYTGVHFGNNPSPFISSNFSDYSSLTIVDQNDSVHGLPINTEINQKYSDSLSCTSDILIERTTTPNYSQNLSYTPFVSNNPGTYEEGTNTQLGLYTDTSSVSGLCPGMYSFNHNNRKKFMFVTDSLQQLDVSYRNLIGDGSNGYMIVPEVDTLKLYYEECTNNYSQPFNTVNSNKTNSQVLTVNIFNTGFNIEEFNMSFDLTQGSNSFYLHERPVTMEDYSAYPNPTPYYTIVELYCESTNKTTIKRRRIIIAPDGTITQEYDGNASLETESSSAEFNVYPNPASDKITIESDHKWSSFDILSTNGKTVFEGSSKMNEENAINTSNFESGVYILRIHGEGIMVTKKLIIE